MILGALQRNALFMSAALPLKIFPPLFNRYAGGHSFGSHVDNAIRQVPRTPHRVRTESLGDALPRRSRRVRRRRARRRGHLRCPQREAPGRAHDSLPVDEPPPRQARDERRAGLVLFLDTEPHPRRRPPNALVRHGHGHPAPRERAPGSSIDRPAHGCVPQPSETVGGAVSSRLASRGSQNSSSRLAACGSRLAEPRERRRSHGLEGELREASRQPRAASSEPRRAANEQHHETTNRSLLDAPDCWPRRRHRDLDHVGHGHAADVPAVGAQESRAAATIRRATGSRRCPARPRHAAGARATGRAGRGGHDGDARFRSAGVGVRRARTARHGLRQPLHGRRTRVGLASCAGVLSIGHELAPLSLDRRRAPRDGPRDHGRVQRGVSRAGDHGALSVVAAAVDVAARERGDALPLRAAWKGPRLQLAQRDRLLVRADPRGADRERDGHLLHLGEQPGLHADRQPETCRSGRTWRRARWRTWRSGGARRRTRRRCQPRRVGPRRAGRGACPA